MSSIIRFAIAMAAGLAVAMQLPVRLGAPAPDSGPPCEVLPCFLSR